MGRASIATLLLSHQTVETRTEMRPVRGTPTSSGKTTLLLFDIDGTLLVSGGAGKRALNRAIEALFGAAGAFDGVPVAGRTDPCCSTMRPLALA